MNRETKHKLLAVLMVIGTILLLGFFALSVRAEKSKMTGSVPSNPYNSCILECKNLYE